MISSRSDRKQALQSLFRMAPLCTYVYLAVFSHLFCLHFPSRKVELLRLRRRTPHVTEKNILLTGFLCKIAKIAPDLGNNSIRVLLG